MLTEEQIKQRIRDYCIEQDGCDLRDAIKLEGRILGLCEALGARNAWKGLSKELLESVGISAIAVNPNWIFEVEESNEETANYRNAN